MFLPNLVYASPHIKKIIETEISYISKSYHPVVKEKFTTIFLNLKKKKIKDIVQIKVSATKITE